MSCAINSYTSDMDFGTRALLCVFIKWGKFPDYLSECYLLKTRLYGINNNKYT